MNELMLVERDGVKLADSRIIAERLGIQHETIMRTINRNKEEIENEFGPLRLEIGVAKNAINGSNPPKYALLNFEQADFLSTLSRNTKEVIAYKAWIVKGFHAARNLILTNQSKPLTPTELALIVIESEKQKLLLEQKLEKAGQRIEELSIQDEIVRQFMSCKGLLPFDEVAKIARIRLKRFYKILKGVVHKNNGQVYANLIATGKVELKPVIRNNTIHTEEYFTPAGAIWFYRTYIIRSNEPGIRTLKLPEFE